VHLEYFILLTLAAGATSFVVVTSIALIIRKAVDVQRQRSRTHLYQHYSAKLAELLLTDLPEIPPDSKTGGIARQYELLVLPMKKRMSKMDPGRRMLHRQALRSVLVDLALDVTGETADRLVYFFSSLGFVQEHIQLLRSKKWWVRAQAARDLGLLRARKAIPTLTLLLEDRNDGARYQAMQSLVTLAGVESLRTILRIAKRLSPWMAIELSVIVMRFEDAAVPYLIEALKSPDQSVVLFSIEMLAEIGFVSAVEPLRALLTEYPSSVVQAKAAEALGRLGDERAEEALLRLVGSPHPHLRTKAIEALGQIGSPAALPTLLRQFAKGSLTEKITTARSIAILGQEGAETIRSLASDPDELNRSVAQQVAEEFALEIAGS